MNFHSYGMIIVYFVELLYCSSVRLQRTLYQILQ